eukprot:CAMPEP_0172387906 /NCGR_PEP_ID=MMETSP1061-20121228/5104_1 /TAXON_ID=37318 /ORGANISM="Pseudo-nitzschia pungens, Strain cf. pungens" /LENGTH=623 /DNA_ID=CAMNT_0013117657 /DNA_START=154 /DNA_END=2025 /DNA_ORIENTATION=+
MVQEQERRDLYEQSKSKTLFFTTSASANLKLTNGKALTGLYKCTLETPEDLFDDFTHYGEDEEICNAATRVSDGHNFGGDENADFVLRNLQFDLSSLRTNSPESAGNNFLYANTHRAQYLKGEPSDWEIVRARVAGTGTGTGTGTGEIEIENKVTGAEDGSLAFESVFKTRAVIDWNECNFRCCTVSDYEAMGYSEDAKKLDNDDDEYKYAYAQTVVRSFVIDEHTGDLYVSWEGFHKDCQQSFSQGQKLQWTLGVSRLKTEDPTCVLLDPVLANEHFSHSSNFSRCTEPVSIVYQSTRGREAVMPYGGLAVIPASQTGSRRVFLLSVLDSSGTASGELTSRVWAFPEGIDSIRDGVDATDLTGSGTVVAGIHRDSSVWDGGSLRLNYNPQTQKPDHLCRSVYEAGIECIPIDVFSDDNKLPVVRPDSKTKDIFLSKDQTANFCRLNIADKAFAREFTLVTGLDVQWDPITGQPHRIFFGCWGGKDGTGNFGSVQKDGQHLKQIMHNAYADAVLFLPNEVEVAAKSSTTSRVAADATANANSWVSQQNPLSLQPFGVMAFLSILCVVAVTMYKRKQQHRFSSHTTLQRQTGFGTPYVELQNMHTNMVPPGSMSMDASPSTSFV